MKDEVDFVTNDTDGTFWMTVQDFSKYYEGVAVCKLEEGFNYNSIAVTDNSGDENGHLIVRAVLK